MHAQAKRGYTLVELLVVIAVLAILAGITVASLRASRSHQILEQSAARLEWLLDSARAAALAERIPVFLATADDGPLRHRALLLLRDPDSPVALRDWQILPPGLLLMEGEEGNLLEMDPIRRLPALEAGGVSASLAVLVEIGPDGRFRVGEARRPEPAHLLLQRVLDRPDSFGNPVPVEPVDALRILFRPLTGSTRVERVLP